MLIQSQDCKQIVTLDKLYVKDNYIVYGTKHSGGDIIGIYNNHKEASIVFNDIIMDYHSDLKISILPLKDDVNTMSVNVGSIDSETGKDL